MLFVIGGMYTSHMPENQRIFDIGSQKKSGGLFTVVDVASTNSLV